MRQVFRLMLVTEYGLDAERMAGIVDDALPFERQEPGYALEVEAIAEPVQFGGRTYSRATRGDAE